MSRKVNHSRSINASHPAKTLELCRQYQLSLQCLWFVPPLQTCAALVFAILLSFAALTQSRAIGQTTRLWQPAPAASDPQAMTQHYFQTIARGYLSGVRTPLQVVARTEAEWNALWRQHSPIQATPLPLPVIDFEKQIVVGHFLGDKPTGGYDVEVMRVVQSHDELVIYHREKSPAAGSLTTQSLTQPFHIVQVSGTINSRVIFRRES